MWHCLICFILQCVYVCVDDDDLIVFIVRYGITNYENEVRRFEEEEENKKWGGKR